MKKGEEKLDLSRAFAAPPESYARKTRTTLNSLEEEAEVKKFSFSMALALVCAFVLMSTAIAAGINGGFINDDKVLSHNTDGAGIQLVEGEIIAENDYATLKVLESHNNGDIMYALVQLTPKDDNKLQYSRIMEYFTKLAGEIVAQHESGEMNDEDFVKSLEHVVGLMGERESEEQAASIGIIGGADGPTAIFVAGKSGAGDEAEPAGEVNSESTESPSAEIIGGADGPTAIYVAGKSVAGDEAEPAGEINSESTKSPSEEIIGGADGDTEILVAGKSGAGDESEPAGEVNSELTKSPSAEIIGGADGPTAIFVGGMDGAGALYVTDVRIFNGESNDTVAVADVSDATEHDENAIVLAIVCGGNSGDMPVKILMNIDGQELECNYTAPIETAQGIDSACYVHQLTPTNLPEGMNASEVAIITNDSFTVLAAALTKGTDAAGAGADGLRREVFVEDKDMAYIKYGADGSIKSIISLPSLAYYTTDGGVYYHSDENCNGIKGAQAVSLSEAISAGKQPCKICVSPDEAGENTLPIFSLAGDGSDLDDAHSCHVTVNTDSDGNVTYYIYQIFSGKTQLGDSIDAYMYVGDGQYQKVAFDVAK